MTPRENLIHFLRNEPYEWTPTSLDQLSFRPAFIADNVSRGLVIQQQPYTGKLGGADMFGIEWFYDPAAGGSMEVGRLLDELEQWHDKLRFPDLEAMDWERCAKENAELLNTDKLICTTVYTGFFERLISLVGFEDAAVALLDEEEQEEVKKLFDALADFYIDLIAHLHRYFNVEYVELHDDWGTQNSTIFSPDTHTELIMPYVRRVARAAHAQGVFIEQHSCGKIETLVPNIIESEVDTWRGQSSVIDKKMLVDTYGEQFKFGVEIRPEGPVSDAEAMAMADDVLRNYHGKNIIIFLTRTLSPSQKKVIYDKIRSIGRI